MFISLKGEKSFYDVAEEKNFSDSNYPHANTGLTIMRVVLLSFKFLLVFGVLGILLNFLIQHYQIRDPDFSQLRWFQQSWFGANGINIDAISRDLDLDKLALLFQNIGNLIVFCMVWLNSGLFKLSVIGFVISFVFWSLVAILRSRSYERHLLGNDIEAIFLKDDLIRRLSIDRRLKHAKRVLNAERSKSSYDTDQILNHESMVEALQSIKNMKVYINTRQSLNDYTVEKRYRVTFNTNFNNAANEKMFGELKKIEKLADVAVRGKVSFGSGVESQDRMTITMTAISIAKDPYDFSDWIEDVQETGTYEYSFSLSHLVDNREKIKVLTHKATLWAERTGNALDSLFATGGAKVDRLSTFISASNAIFTYKMSFRIDFQSFDKYQDSIDKNFGTRGTSIQIKNGNLLIAVPLPKELIVPIDVGSMYREVFGDNDE